MGDKVRIYPHETKMAGRTVYVAMCELVTDQPSTVQPMPLFSTDDRDEFFRRYNALVVEKEPAPKEDDAHG